MPLPANASTDSARPGPDAPIAGRCDPAFRAVEGVFRENFRSRDEIGAGLCVRVAGRVVVDLWGGHTDAMRRRPWRRDTLVNAYSVGKGIAAMLALALVERGVLDLDAPVARRWPEFAAHDKDAVTLRMLLAHRGGLPGIHRPLPEDAMLDWGVMTRALAEEAPWWTPGEDHGYHVNTHGFLVGEPIVRALGVPFSEALRRALTGPLDADFRIGLPRAEHHRVAHTVLPIGDGSDGRPPDLESMTRVEPEADAERRAWLARIYFNPPGFSGFGVVNTPRWRQASIPSTNGQGTARAVAKLYDAFLRLEPGRGGFVGAGLRAQALSIHSDGPDRVLGRPSRFGLGFQLSQPSRPIGGGPRGFGHFGYGGSVGFADPDAELAFGYLMNHPGERWLAPRTLALVGAVYESLGVATETPATASVAGDHPVLHVDARADRNGAQAHGRDRNDAR